MAGYSEDGVRLFLELCSKKNPFSEVSKSVEQTLRVLLTRIKGEERWKKMDLKESQR